MVRPSVPDVTAWPDTSLDAWIRAGVRHYSGRFPRLWTHSISAVADVQLYDLPAHAVSVSTVEFPAGRFPAQYLVPVEPLDSRMQTGGAAYTLIGTDDGGVAIQNGRLLLAPVVAGGETLTVGYRAPHPEPLTDVAVLTVPDQYLGILVQYCVWSAMQAKLTGEVAEPYRNMGLVGQLTESVAAAWELLGEMMAAAYALTLDATAEIVEDVEETAVSAVVVWRDENTERIY